MIVLNRAVSIRGNIPIMWLEMKNLLFVNDMRAIEQQGGHMGAAVKSLLKPETLKP